MLVAGACAGPGNRRDTYVSIAGPASRATGSYGHMPYSTPASEVRIVDIDLCDVLCCSCDEFPTPQTTQELY